MGQSKEFGAAGEDIAARYLEERGFSILERNFRLGRRGEIDIIARKNNVITFVEVKRRRTGLYGGPLYSISPSKKKKLRLIASGFLAANQKLNTQNITFRFDLLAIENGSIEWIQDILR